jgi:hypothetical protein
MGGLFELFFPATWGLGGCMGDESESVPEGKVSDQVALIAPRSCQPAIKVATHASIAQSVNHL